MASHISVVFPIIAALTSGEGTFLQENGEWKAQGKYQTQQQEFLKDYFTPTIKKEAKTAFSSDELKSFASNDSKALNEKLQQWNSTIKFDPFGPHQFGEVSILNISLHWLKKGSKENFSYQNKQYKAAKLETGFELFKVHEKVHPHPIAALKTKDPSPMTDVKGSAEGHGKDVVYMTLADGEPKDSFDLMHRINKIRTGLKEERSVQLASYVQFPTVLLNVKERIDWLTGMQAPDKNNPQLPWYIFQAEQETRLSMDEVGVKIRSVVAVGVTRGGGTPEKPFIIDKPFFVWMERKGCTLPIFYAYCDPSCWQEYSREKEAFETAEDKKYALVDEIEDFKNQSKNLIMQLWQQVYAQASKNDNPTDEELITALTDAIKNNEPLLQIIKTLSENSNNKIEDMVKKNPQGLERYRNLQRKGVQWPHTQAMRRKCEEAGFVYRPMMVKRDRMVCESCTAEFYGFIYFFDQTNPDAFVPKVFHYPECSTLASYNSTATDLVKANELKGGTGTALERTINRLNAALIRKKSNLIALKATLEQQKKVPPETKKGQEAEPQSCAREIEGNPMAEKPADTPENITKLEQNINFWFSTNSLYGQLVGWLRCANYIVDPRANLAP